MRTRVGREERRNARRGERRKVRRGALAGRGMKTMARMRMRRCG
jgi:hypothetical protein